MGAKVAGMAYQYLGGESIDTTADVIMSGMGEWNYFGRSVSGAGDVNKDGFDDVLVGSDVDGMGYVRVYFGAAQMDNSPDAFLFTNLYGDRFGYTVSGGGDLDGNGYSDVIVGGIGDYTNWVPEDDQGSIHLFYGGDSLDNEPEAVFHGITSQPYFAAHVSHAGDVNGDGYPDLIVGDTDYLINYRHAGRAFVYLGSEDHDGTPDMVLSGNHFDYHYNFGMEVKCAGDLNNDGYSDLFVKEGGFKTDNNQYYVFFGGNPMDTIPDWAFPVGDDPYGFFQFLPSGDVNNDGYDDVLIKTVHEKKAYILFGGEIAGMNGFLLDQGNILNMETGDLNGDSHTDIILSCYEADEYPYFKVFFGGPELDTIPDIVLDVEFLEKSWATSVRSGEDINNDGYDDVIINNVYYDVSPDGHEGRVYILFGGVDMDAIPDITLTGDQPLEYLGMRSIFLPDLNADGYAEVLISKGRHIDEYPGLGMNIYFGGNPMDTIPDVFLSHAGERDLSVYTVPGTDSVVIIIGDPGLSAVLAYTNINLLPEPVGTAHRLMESQSIFHYNYPNPFRSETRIAYELMTECDVELSIYNILGQRIATLVSETQEKGKHYASWDASDIPEGVYIYNIIAGQARHVGMMILSK
jgi:hypothetical protein